MKRRGFALPMTIIAVAGLTLLLIGLVTVLTLEQKTARSYSNTTRADFAVESGLAAALATVTEVAKLDDSIVFRLEDPVDPEVADTSRPLGYREQFFTYGAVFDDTADAWRAIPLFSAENEVSVTSADPTNGVPIDTTDVVTSLANYVTDAQTLGAVTEHDQNIPRAKWVEIPSSDPDGYTFRYSFWVEDLSGRIDGKNSGLLSRADGTSTAELEYATIIDPTADDPVIPTNFVDARDKLRTPASVRIKRGTNNEEILTEAEAKRLEPYIHFYDLSQFGFGRKVIPQGFGYKSAGLEPKDLNELVADADVEAMATYIDEEIPSFQLRKGGFPDSDDYLKTVSASIIDYADADSDATTGTGYRGIDSYPYVNEVFDRYEWVSSDADTVSVEVETYLELWNPSDKEITGSMVFKNINKRQLKLGGNGDVDFETDTYPAVNVTIPANGFRVGLAGSRTYNFPVDLQPAQPLEFNSDDSESSFELIWNGVVVDKPKAGVERTYSFLRSGLSNRQWKGNSAPPLDSSIGQFGDPRASFYINDYFRKTDYGDNSNWGGRAIKRNFNKALPYREVRLEQWPDRGSNSTLGVASGTDARIPTDTKIVLKSSGNAIAGKDFPAKQPELAPTRISNSGSYESLAELGNIFDPAQWNEVDQATFSSDELSGGGITLAVGRPEYAAFDESGKRAAQLLDIFSLTRTNPVTSPQININTAPREVLRSLIAGVTLDEDPVATEVSIQKEATDPTIGDIFADQVIAYRNKFPIRSISDLNLIREDPSVARNFSTTTNHPFFGNPENYLDEPAIAPRTDPTQEYDQTDFEEWNDAGREELFRKVSELVKYRSNLFRIVVAGEALDKNGKRISGSIREYHYGVYPERDASGALVSGGTPEIIKYYETNK